ncbi:MAG: NAD(+)/NADH kinase, partial [Gemmatimonadetes bacterium]|nr:NAD(+)/NADH kinase [Gemmatimonadota bacterium]
MTAPTIPVFLNTRAGRSPATPAALRDHFGDSIHIIPTDPQSLHEAVARAASAGEPIIGIAGGDGTMRTAAAALVHTGSALLSIPAGTLNTFARRNGIPDLAAAAAALRAPRIVSVAVGSVQDQVFLNTLTFGEYSRIVRKRERLRRYLGKWPAAAVAIVTTLATLQRMTVRLQADDQTRVRETPVVWVGLGWGSFPLLQLALERRSEPDLEVVLLRPVTKRAAAATLFRLARDLLRERTPLRDAQLEVLHARAMVLERASAATASPDLPAELHGIAATAEHGIDAT